MSSSRRSQKFSPKEESLLLSLIEKYKKVIDNRKTDSITNKAKAQCWKKVAILFNHESGEIFRAANTLRIKYENIKKRSRKKIVDETYQVASPESEAPERPIGLKNHSIQQYLSLETRKAGLPDEFHEDLDNSCDENEYGTEIGAKQVYSPEVSIEEEPESLILTNAQDSEKKSTDITSGYLRAKRKYEYEELCSKENQWAGVKSTLETEKMKFLREEHSMKLSLLKQKCDAEVEALRKVADAKIRRIEKETEVTTLGILEEHKIKMEILALEKQLIQKQIK